MALKRMVTLPKINTTLPPSIANPSSLNPSTTTSFSDNMTKPLYIPEDISKSTGFTPMGNTQINQSNPRGNQSTTNQSNVTNQNIPNQTDTTNKPTYSTTLFDPNNYLGKGISKDAFMQLDDIEQKNLIDSAVFDVNQRQDIMNQVKTYSANKAQEEQLRKQEELRKSTETANMNVADIQAGQRIREAQQGLDNLKQNLGFLGTGGRAMKSRNAMDGMSRSLQNAETTLNEIKKIESEYKIVRDNNKEYNSNAFEFAIKGLQDQLKQQVDNSILQAMQGFNSESALASIDTPKKLFELQQKYLEKIDTSVEGITNRQIQEMNNLQARFTDYLSKASEQAKLDQAQQAEYIKNKNTLNEPMSKAMGYYVDGNGSPLQTTDGKVIEYKNDADKPIIDWNTGKVAYFNTDANGNQVVEVKQLFTPEQKAPNIQKVGTDENGNDIYGYYNQSTGEIKTIGSNTVPGSNPQVSDPSVQTSIAQYSQQQRGKTTLQCGELVNDYIKKETGSKGSLGNSFADKVAGIDKIGRSDTPIVGGIFAFDIKTSQGNTGHTGIVTGVNPDGSITVLEANRKENSVNGGVPSPGTYSPEQVKSMVFSKAPKPTSEVLDKRMSVQGLIQGLGGTEGERAKFANNIIKVAERDGITLQEAKKKLGYKSGDDIEFAKSRSDQFKAIKKSAEAITKGKQALSLLNSGKATAIKDVATIVGFLKTIDPNSVARESEVESVEKARGILDSLSNTFEKMNSGKKLTDTQRKELKDTIGIIVNEYENNMKDFITSSSQEFDDRGLDMTVYVPKDTINKYKQMQSTQQTTGTLSGGTNRLKK